MLVKHQDIHEGLWGMYAELGNTAANINSDPQGDSGPAAITPLARLGLPRYDVEVLSRTVDAAVVNPVPSSSASVE